MEEKKTFTMDEFRSFIGTLIAKGLSIDDSSLNSYLVERINCQFIEQLQDSKYKTFNDDLLSLSGALLLPDRKCPIHSATGYQDPMTAKEEVNLNTSFNIGSISKFIIMNLIMLLIKNNLLTLDQSIATFSCADKIAMNQSITIRHLLAHYSGLKDNGFVKFKEKDDLDILLNTTRAGKSGEKFYYSNVNFVVLSRIIEEITQCSLDQCIQKYIVEPFHLENTHVIHPDDENYAKGYKYDVNSGQLKMASHFFIWGATNIRATPTDLVILLKNFFENDFYMPSHLRDEVITACHEVDFEVVTKEAVYKWPATFGLGIERHSLGKLTGNQQYNDQYCYGHGGWQDSNVAFLAYCPNTKSAYCLAGAKTQGLEKLSRLVTNNLSFINRANERVAPSPLKTPKENEFTLEENNIRL